MAEWTDERKEIRRRLEAMGISEKTGWLLGPDTARQEWNYDFYDLPAVWLHKDGLSQDCCIVIDHQTGALNLMRPLPETTLFPCPVYDKKRIVDYMRGLRGCLSFIFGPFRR